MNAKSIAAVVLLATGMASAAQTLETAYRTNGAEVKSAFDSVRAVLQASSAVVQREKVVTRGDRKVTTYDEVAYGTVISEDGYIFTKASEITDSSGLVVTIGNKLHTNPEIIATDAAWDVALIKVPVTGLKPVQLVLDQPEPSRGIWVVANGSTSRTQRQIQVGIIAANAREIPHAGGPVLGVSFEDKGKKLVVTEVAEKSGAATAGIEKDDVLLLADGEKITGAEVLGELVKKHHVGDQMALTVERKGKKMELKVELKGRADVFGEELTRNDMMSGAFSARRSGFPRVIQHDIIANASSIGGPLLDLDGRCLGMNIARANRCETFAIPASDLKSIADRLISQAK